MRGRSISILLLVALLVTAAACGDDADSAGPASSTSTTAAARDVLALPPFSALQPGTYSVDPDEDPSTPLRVTYEVSAPGWSQWKGASKENPAPGYTMLTITSIDNVVKDGCKDHSPAEPPVGASVDDLASALTKLEPFEVTKTPTDVTLLGYRGKFLEWTVPDLPAVVGAGDEEGFRDCSNNQLHSWIGAEGESYFGYNGEPGRKEEFWILDVDGTRLAIITNLSATSPPQDVAELRAIIDSIRIDT